MTWTFAPRRWGEVEVEAVAAFCCEAPTAVHLLACWPRWIAIVLLVCPQLLPSISASKLCHPLPLQAEAERSQLAEELAAERERLQGEAQQVGGAWWRCGQAVGVATTGS